MHIRALTIENFRNLAQVTLEPHPRFNVLSGDNGQGKTNLLEAAYLLATLRSFRTARSDELVRLGQTQSVLRARVERQGTERVLSVELTRQPSSSAATTTPTTKIARVDGKTARVADYFGGMNAVLFSPDDLRLPKGPPAGRRRLLDRAVWNAAPSFLTEAQTYERLLRSRNAVLRRPPADSQDAAGLLDVYDEQLAAAGAVMLARRHAYLSELQPFFDTAFTRVSQTGLVAGLRYRLAGALGRAQAKAPEDAPAAAPTAEVIAHQLRRDRHRDQLRGYTHSGPHADDLEFLLAAQPAAQYASQGQLRALVLAFKIAEIRLLLARLSDTPVLLLDDVSSELDSERNHNLFAFLREVPCQAFITTTSADHIKLSPHASLGGDSDRRDFRVKGGFIDVLG